MEGLGHQESENGCRCTLDKFCFQMTFFGGASFACVGKKVMMEAFISPWHQPLQGNAIFCAFLLFCAFLISEIFCFHFFESPSGVPPPLMEAGSMQPLTHWLTLSDWFFQSDSQSLVFGRTTSPREGGRQKTS